jgi:FtsP/CotA-like multicopper oxidase with cupredoxin domain
MESAQMMQVAHPIHFHGRQFQIRARSVTAGGQAGWNQLVPGCVDAGWKDTLLVMPGETVDLLLRYGQHTGLFVYHCQNLAHEDDGMMRNLRIDP